MDIYAQELYPAARDARQTPDRYFRLLVGRGMKPIPGQIVDVPADLALGR